MSCCRNTDVFEQGVLLQTLLETSDNIEHLHHITSPDLTSVNFETHLFPGLQAVVGHFHI